MPLPVVNDLNQPSRPTDRQCNWFCAPVDISSWGRALLSINDRAVVLFNAATPEERETDPMRALFQWQEDSKRYAELGLSLSNLWGMTSNLYPALTLNSTVVKDLARRAEDGQVLLDQAAEAIGAPAPLALPGSQLARPVALDFGDMLPALALLGAWFYFAGGDE